MYFHIKPLKHTFEVLRYFRGPKGGAQRTKTHGETCPNFSEKKNLHIYLYIVIRPGNAHTRPASLSCY